MDDFLIVYRLNLKPKDFEAREEMFNDKKGKRICLNKLNTKELTNEIHDFFKRKTDIPQNLIFLSIMSLLESS